MRKAIATVALPEKLEAIVHTGFAAVEIFADDLEAFPGSALAVRRLTEALDLEVLLLRPLRDYVGAPAERRAGANESAQRLLENMNQLGYRLLLVVA